jgi:EAL domain-containing protein (putative c-di-GMP-specific phosphodiesterase class I)
MSCKCNEIVNPFEHGDEIIMFFYADEVAKMALNRVREAGFEANLKDTALVVKLINHEKDLLYIVEKILKLDETEMTGIMALLRDSGSPLTLEELKLSRPLIHFVELARNIEVLDLIAHQRFFNHFQPIVDLRENEIIGYEVLLRGLDREGKIVPPNKIFEFAKKADLIYYLDRYAREIAIRNIAKHGITKLAFINFLPSSIYRPEYCLRTTLNLINELGIKKEQIAFEVVETEKITDIDHLKNILNYYREFGFKVVLDDLGNGYSSLILLAKLKPHIIKIDREIISGINEDSLKQAIFKALVQVAHDNGILVLAEGVEKEEEANWIRDHVADLAQGFYFGRPSEVPQTYIFQ